nr:MAG TPA: tail protein [Caudoviricetes sp.]
MTIVASNSLTVSNVYDGTITHTAWSYSADGTDRFTTTYPNLNLLDGSKDFSGTWTFSGGWTNDGTYKGLTVKKKTGRWNGIYKTFTAPKDGDYTFSAYIKSSGDTANIFRYGRVNTTSSQPIIQKQIGNNFDWTRDNVTINLKANDSVWVRYEISGAGTDSILWNAGHKWEPGSITTPYMQSASEVTTADWPKYSGEYSDMSSEQSTNPSDYTWGPMRGDDGKDGLDGKDGIAGKDGVGIKTTVITYAISTNGTTAPATGWTSSVPGLVKGQYLWTKTVWTYTDNSSETGYTVSYISKDGNNGTDGLAGKDGVGIKTTAITYASHTNGTTAPTTGYTATVPSVPAGQFLWTKTIWTYTDNSTETGYSVAMMGLKGDKGDQGIKGTDGIAGKDGKGINLTTITYSISTSGTTAPTTGYTSTVPTLVKGQYLWTKTVWRYTDNSTETGYSVTYIAKDGNNGTNGIAGKDGTGIKTTTITYAGSTSGTTAPTSGWTSTVPTVAAGSYLWTKTLWTYTDNSFETGYSVAKMGNTGPAGPSGSNGDPGTSAINIDLSNKSYNFLANLEVSDSGSVMQAVTGSTTTTFTALQGTAAINITALTCTTTLPTGMTVSIGTLNALSVVVTISVDDTMIMPNGVLNFSITAGGVTTTKSFSYSLAINDLTVINLAAINSNLGNVKNIYSNYNGSDGGTYSGTIEINDENIKITATNDNDSNEVSKTQMNGENGIWHSTKLQKTNSPGVYILSNWSLTGTTLSFESQQSDLTYPNGYYYASYGIDMHARNIVGDSISQTTDVDWTSIGTYTKYKRQGNRITLSVVDAMVTTAGNITLGTLPAKDAPYNSIMLTAIAFATTNTNDKHIQINGTYGSGGGLITILGAAANQKYTFQQTFELT